ncbi:glycosyltransferase family 2 protein [Christiangramia sp. LLG6405-1]|uniref:glycosyltransferase family 2 protein n=1 Tax=Christiangramia sp. LLG6405-1 TaxID=3160832 RepID=UPI00386F6E5E
MSLDIVERKKGISIIIPTFNRAEFVKDAISSVIQQGYPGPIEIIISDDGSTDRTLAAASSFGSKVIILKKPKDCSTQGASGARNRGILSATQPFICFLDSDDFYLPGHLEKMENAISSDAELGFALCNSLEMLNNKKEERFRRWTKTNIEPRDLDNLSITTIHFANSNGFIFKKEVFEKVGLFNEDIQVGEDSDMWMRINEKFKGKYANHYGTVIRIHDLDQLTKIPKYDLIKGHYKVYRSALRRYYTLGLNDSYRCRALSVLSLKYKISQWPVLKNIYLFMANRKSKNKTNMQEDSSWKTLKHFSDQNQQLVLDRS